MLGSQREGFGREERRGEGGLGVERAFFFSLEKEKKEENLEEGLGLRLGLGVVHVLMGTTERDFMMHIHIILSLM